MMSYLSFRAMVFVLVFGLYCLLLADATGGTPGVQSCGCGSTCSAAGVATYKVEFNAIWPLASYVIPRFAHWSRLVGASHSACAVLWRNNIQCSPGIEAMAEFGGTGTLNSEVTALGSQHRPPTIEVTSGIGSAAGRRSTMFTADRYRPFVSLTSMIAPSPDWFLGVDSVPMCNGSRWVQSVTYDLLPWDAGTDGGLTYEAGDVDITPNGNTVRIRPSNTNLATNLYQSGVTNPAPMGELIFTFLSVDTAASITDPNCTPCTSTCTKSYDVLVDTRKAPETYVSNSSTTTGAPQTTTSTASSVTPYTFVGILFTLVVSAIFCRW